MNERGDTRATWRGPAVAAAVLAMLPYVRTLWNGAVWDDGPLVARNPSLRSLGGVVTMLFHDMWSTSASHEHSDYWRPLPMLTYAIDGALGGYRPAVWHAGNVLMHGLVVLAVARAIAALVDGATPWLAAAVALAWGLAPEHSEPVAWISDRFDLLLALFAALAVVVDAPGRRDRAARVVATCAAALLSKEAGIVVPALIVGADVLVHRRAIRDEVAKYAALAATVVAYLGARAAIGVISGRAAPDPLAFVRGYAFIVASVLRLLVVPLGLDAYNPYRAPSLGAALAIDAAVALVVLGAAWLPRKHPARSPARAASYGLAWFAVTIAPAGLTGPALDMTGDRYAYLPDVGLAIAAAAGCVALGARFPALARPAARGAIATAVIALLGLWSSLAWARLADWKTDESLAEASLRVHPRNAYALYSLGERRLLGGDVDGAVPLLRDAIDAGPRPWRALNAMCLARIRQSRFAEAEHACAASVSINGRNASTWVNLATLYVKTEHWDRALETAREAMRVRSPYPEAHYLAGVALLKMGKPDEAADEARAALESNPDHAGARALLGYILRPPAP